jgi:hypothetical protein
MRQLLARLAAVVLILSSTACEFGDSPDFTWLRAMHAMPDSPALRVSFENYVFRRDVSFGTGTTEGGESLLSSAGPTARLTVEFRAPDGTTGGTLLNRDVPVQKDATSTVILAGSFDDPETIIVVTPRLPRPLSAIHVQFAHAALELGAMDVYVTAPDTALTSTAPIATVQPRGHTEILQIPFGDTRIRLTPAGSLDVLMDSGELDFREVEGTTGPGMQWLFTVSPSVLAGPSPVLLIGSTGRQTFRFLDAGTPAALRAVHASPDAPAADVVAGDPQVTLFSGLEYRARSPLLAAPAGDDVLLGFRVAEPEGELIVAAEEELVQGEEYSAFLIGALEDAEIRVATSQTRSIVTEAKVRFANLAPEAKFFSIHLTSTEGEVLAAGNRLLRDLRFGVVSSHLVRPPGNYFLTITERFFEQPADAADAVESIVFGPTPLELVGGDVLTWVFFAPENEGEAEVLERFDDRLP